MPTANTFYIAANIIFDLDTGHTKQVLMLVNKAEDASTFNRTDADNYVDFVKQRARNIVWSVEYLQSSTAGFAALSGPRYIIKGVQHV